MPPLLSPKVLSNMKDTQQPETAPFPSLIRAWIGDRTLTAAAAALDIGVSTLHGYVHGTARPQRRWIPVLAARMGLPEEQVRAACEAA